MYAEIHHENYGWAVATYGDYVAVSDPDLTRFNINSPTTYHSGAVDYFRYNKQSDLHDFVKRLYLNGHQMEILLARETGSDVTVRDPLHTELGSYSQQDKDILIDYGNNFHVLEDGFGYSLDMWGKLLVVGCPYYSASFTTDDFHVATSGSCVDIFDLGITETSSYLDPFVFSIRNPNVEFSESFGMGVGLNNRWLAVGSPYVSSSKGHVYVYENVSTGSGHYSWSLFQTLSSPSASQGQMFGRSVKINKQTGEYICSMVVGCGGTSSNAAYYYEYTNSVWTHTHTFKPIEDISPLTFGNYVPYKPTMSLNSGYGYDVSLYDSSVIIGAYHDRNVYEYSGSNQYQQGAVYIYEKCPPPSKDFYLDLKTYGTPLTLKNNKLGYSVDMWGGYALAGIPKITNMDICEFQNTIDQLHYCEGDLEKILQGQTILLQKNTGSNHWEIVNVYQRKKRYLSPHRKFGWDVAIDGRSFVVGAPLDVSSSSPIKIDLFVTASDGITLDDLTGKAYIYNLHNFRDEFHVGNVFYRNGKIVIMTSGSAFNGLFFNQISRQNYQYDLVFQSSRTIHEKQIMCTIEPGEFNVSTNPTALVKVTSSLDLNQNGIFDFQDVDVLLRYMQYYYNNETNWSSSLLESDDEISFYNYNSSSWDANQTEALFGSVVNRFQYVEPHFIDKLDINYDNRIDNYDMKVLWKYFANRLNDSVYATCTNINSMRPTFSDAIQYLDFLTKRRETPQILPEFFYYDDLSAADKTGSYLSPYFTTVGLYDGGDLVAVAKVGNPIKLPKTLPLNIVIRMDF